MGNASFEECDNPKKCLQAGRIYVRKNVGIIVIFDNVSLYNPFQYYAKKIDDKTIDCIQLQLLCKFQHN